MKAIVVKYFGPSERRGSRLRVAAEGLPSLTVSYDHSLSDPFRAAAMAFIDKHGWVGELVGGTLPTGESVFVFASCRYR